MFGLFHCDAFSLTNFVHMLAYLSLLSKVPHHKQRQLPIIPSNISHALSTLQGFLKTHQVQEISKVCSFHELLMHGKR